MSPEHGTEKRYNAWGCRCDACRAASSAAHRDRTWQAKERRVLIEGRLVAPGVDVVHGNHSTYTNLWCRCLACTDAHSLRQRRNRDERKARRELVGGRLVATGVERHGLASVYSNHFCRCEPCTQASTDDAAFYREHRRGGAA